MKSSLIRLFAAAAVLFAVAAPALADYPPAGVTSGDDAARAQVRQATRANNSGIGLGAGIGAGIAALGAGIGIGLIGYSALGAMARQPEFAGDLRINMLLAAALIEGPVFFGLIICLLMQLSQ